MREIKFRAWHKEKKVLVGINTIYFGAEMASITTYKDTAVNSCVLENKELEFMQFTGLQDKNGVDIYEGDIVKIDRLRLGIKGIMLKPVVFKFGNFGFETNKTDKWEDFLTLYDYFDFLKYHNFELDFEVIGNIYENPELLEV